MSKLPPNRGMQAYLDKISEEPTKVLCPACEGHGCTVVFSELGRYGTVECKLCNGCGLVTAKTRSEWRMKNPTK